MAASPTLRDRRRQETRRSIHEAAIALSGEHGFANVTVESISARAGISPRTFFNYFPSKEGAVVLGPPVQLREPYASSFTEGVVRTPRELLVELTQALLAQLESDPPRRRTSEDIFAIAATDPSVLAALVTQLDQVRAELATAAARRLPAGTDPQVADMIASLAMAAVRSGLEAWATSRGTDDSPVPYVRHAVDIMTQLTGDSH